METRMPERRFESLDGAWEFRFGDEEAWRRVAVPGPWQAQFDDLRLSFGLGRYRRRIAIPDGPGEAVVRFGAVSEVATVRLDGREVGRHAGGYLPFEVVLPPEAGGEAVLEVDALLPSADPQLHPDRPFAEYPHGKQSWYGPLGGIWQSVEVGRRDPRRIASAAVSAELGSGRVALRLRLSAAAAGCSLRARVVGPDGALAAEGRAEVAGEALAMALSVPAPRPWSPDSPALYRLELELTADGAPADAREERFGFRTVEARDGRLWLNGEPLYLRGALDQDYYPDGICTPPSTAFLEDQFSKAKALGLNCLRCHIKVPDPRYYEVADRLGMLVWTEIPNVERLTERSAARLREVFEGILARDGNHPSIVAWTIINEDWGTRLAEDPDHRAWLAETFDWAKALDPTRLVVDNSPCLPNFHVKTDIDDYHYYRGLPERGEEWDALTAEFAARPPWSFSPHGDAQRTGSEPLVVSEFGVWGLPHPKDLAGPDGREPWWTETGSFWGEGAAYPHGVERRFAELGLGRVFGSFDGFVEAAQWGQFRGLRRQIEAIRRHPSIVGYVITELTDVHWEANGLLDLRRNPRAFHGRFAEVNADAVLVPELPRRALWAGEHLAVAVTVASGGRAVPEGAELRWRFEGAAGSAPVGALAPMGVSAPVPVRAAVPALDAARVAELSLELVAPSGRTIAASAVELSLLPRPAPSGLTVAAEPELAAYLAALGYAVAPLGEADVEVSRGLDAAAVERVRRGGRALVLADGTGGARRDLRLDAPEREPPFLRAVDDRPGLPAANHHRFPGLGLAERHGTLWRGDWLGNFSWLRREGPFAALPGGPMLDLSFDRVAPRHVLTGFSAWEWEHRVHAGVVVGWVHKPAALVGERPFGRGTLVAATFRLTLDPPGRDPVAATLMRALIEQAAGRRGPGRAGSA